jgi:hypothetical protein
VAYCWRDRLESTATWFGLCDEKGKPKATCLALQKLWTGQAAKRPVQLAALRGLPARAEPGQQVDLRALAEASGQGALQYRWRMASEVFNFKVGEIAATPGSSKARVTLPTRPGIYRVYVDVSDGTTCDQVNFPVEVVDPVALANKTREFPLDGTRVGSINR